MKTIRIFISSPGDVKEERQRAVEVIQSLRRRYVRTFNLVPVVWEDLPLEPDMSFQQGIDLFLESPGVDIAVFILWSRLGSPLGPAICKQDGSSYRSGTEREYDLLIQARRQTREKEGISRPRMIVYTRRDDASFHQRLRNKRTEELADLLAQKQLAESFMQENFTDSETRANVGAYHPFDRPVTFSHRLRAHLQAMLDEMAGDQQQVIWDCSRQGPPFLGLEAFQPQHADVFFGRECEVLEARRALKRQAANGCAFLLLSGASGSGKSSLARAGLLPEILAHEPDAGAEVWKSLIITPASIAPDPVLGLLEVLGAEDLLQELASQGPSLAEMAADLSRDPVTFFSYTLGKALALASARLGGAVRLVILIDQLEELFITESIKPAARSSFLSLVEVLARNGFWVLATVRSDFYEELQSEPALVRMKEGGGMMDVLPPHPDAIARLIEEPARIAGLAFETVDGQPLARRIVRDASLQPELLPMLEFVLLELFEAGAGEGLLTHAVYDRLGGVDGALRRKAEETYRSLPDDAREAFGPVMQKLITVGNETGSTEAEQEKPVRLHAPLDSFVPGTPARRVIDDFVKARLFTTGFTSAADSATVSVAHESLLRVWDRLQEWRKANRDFLVTRARVNARLQEGSPLLKGDPLLEFARYFLGTRSDGFTPAQATWIRAAIEDAEAAEKRARIRRRLAFASLAVFATAATVSAVWARGAEAEALHKQEQAQVAEQKARVSEEKARQALETEIRNSSVYKAANQRTFQAIETYFSAFPEDQVLEMLADFTAMMKKAINGIPEESRPAKLINDLASLQEIHALIALRNGAKAGNPKPLDAMAKALALYNESLLLREQGLKHRPEPADCIAVAEQFLSQLQGKNEIPKQFSPIYRPLMRRKGEILGRYLELVPADYPTFEQQIVPLRSKLEKAVSSL